MRFLLFLLLTCQVQAFPKIYGEWTLWHSTLPHLPDNRVVVHIYPENKLSMKYRFMKGPIVFHKSKMGDFRITNMKRKEEEEEKHMVEVYFHKTEEVFLSVYGIGLQNFNIKTKKKHTKTRFEFTTTFAGVDDIYLQSTSQDNACFHLVRSVRINEPSVDIPISTFLITQVLGTILGHVINELVFHSSN